MGEDPPHGVTCLLLGVREGTCLRSRRRRGTGWREGRGGRLREGFRAGRREGFRAGRRAGRRERIADGQGIPVGSLLTGEGEYDAKLAAVRHAVAEPELDPRQRRGR